MVFDLGGGSRALLYIEILGPKLLYNSLCQTETVYYELKKLLVFKQNNFGHLHSNFRVLLIKHFSAPPPPHAYIAADNFSYEAVFCGCRGCPCAHPGPQGYEDVLQQQLCMFLLGLYPLETNKISLLSRFHCCCNFSHSSTF